MLAYLRGIVTHKEMTGGPNDRVVLDVAGVGFDLIVSHRTLLSLKAVGEETTVYTSLSIRENEWTIFGFSDRDEKELFGILQTVSGIGPKSALAIVGTLGVNQLTEAILSENQKMISQAPGVGAKVAQRIILELKTRIEEWTEKHGQSSPAGQSANTPVHEEVHAILEGLGYTATEINSALKKAADEGLKDDVEDIVRYSLKILGSKALIQQ